MEELWKYMATHSSSGHRHCHHPQPSTNQTPLYEFLASPIYTSPTQSSDDLKSCPTNLTCHNNTSLEPQGFGTCPCSSYMTSLCLPKISMDNENSGGGDRRYKRKMKNRESATRSRARRQAYTAELENEVAQLREENAILRKQQEEMSSAADAVSRAALPQVPKRKTLPRSFTAPF